MLREVGTTDGRIGPLPRLGSFSVPFLSSEDSLCTPDAGGKSGRGSNGVRLGSCYATVGGKGLNVPFTIAVCEGQRSKLQRLGTDEFEVDD